jgi:phosphoribosylanthranilate isomerase
LTPENVAAAVQLVQPQFVDVSSGIETNGVKDVAKMYAFVRAAKQADNATSNDAADRHGRFPDQ